MFSSITGGCSEGLGVFFLFIFLKTKKTLYFILVLNFTVPKYFFPPGGIASSSFFKRNKKNYYYCNPELLLIF